MATDLSAIIPRSSQLTLTERILTYLVLAIPVSLRATGYHPIIPIALVETFTSHAIILALQDTRLEAHTDFLLSGAIAWLIVQSVMLAYFVRAAKAWMRIGPTALAALEGRGDAILVTRVVLLSLILASIVYIVSALGNLLA